MGRGRDGGKAHFPKILTFNLEPKQLVGAGGLILELFIQFPL
jgi:hypothetical protein